MPESTGVFTLSLDTELAWGTFDLDLVEQFEQAYRATPDVIDELCNLFEEYEISATWAIVSHLLEDCDGNHADRTSPDFKGVDGWFDEMPCSSGLDRDLWHASWIIDRLQDCETDQEIGLHGATHMPIGADGGSRQNAEEELETGVDTLREHGVEPRSFIFPRNNVRHVDVLAEHGMIAYRGVDRRWYERSSVPNGMRLLLRFADEAARISPPAVKPVVRDGIVEIPGSQVFRPSYGGWQFIPGESSVTRAKKGLRRAVETGDLYHLWLHPFNLGHAPEKDIPRLEKVLQLASELAATNSLEIRPMAEVASLAKKGRWA